MLAWLVDKMITANKIKLHVISLLELPHVYKGLYFEKLCGILPA